jgi:N-acetylglucosaminyl-diphospho-decaprenol L-rhamnosyltransferase
METIVVDNSSSDAGAEMVRSEFPDVVLISSSVNVGYAAGNNLGFGQATGDYVLTLNPDTEINETTLDAALEVLRNDDRAGCVGVKQIGADGAVQASVRGFPTLLGIVGDILKIRRGRLDSYRLSRFDYSVTQIAPQPMGTFLIFKRSALAAIGDPLQPFDPRFPIFFNEVDLLYRLSQAGFHCVYTPKASILHHGGESTKQVRPKMIWESHRSLLRFFSKHAASPLQRAAVAFITPGIYLAAWVRAKGYHAGFRA